VQLTFMMNTVNAPANPECLRICPGFTSAGQEAWGSRVFAALPPDGSGGKVEAWPAFCTLPHAVRTEEVWSSVLHRGFNMTITLPPSILENRLPRRERDMPSVVFKLDGQYFWPAARGGGDPFLETFAEIGAAREFIVVDVDLSINGNALWRHPLLTPSTLKACPEDSHALRFLPSLRDTWEKYQPLYQKLNGTYGFGKADAFLAFLFDEYLPRFAAAHLPSGPGGRALKLRDLDVGLWGISDAGYTAWYGAWTRPGDFDVAWTQTPFFLWNCGEALDEVLRTGAAWRGRRPAGELPRFYMDHGDQEDPHAYGAPIDAFYKALLKLDIKDGQDLFLVHGTGDGHFGNGFYKRSVKALLALYGAKAGGLQYSAPSL